MDIWQINSYEYGQKISRRIDGKLDPLHSLLFQFKAYSLSFYNFKMTITPPFSMLGEKKHKNNLVSYLKHKYTNG